jgi:hypothetical protein
MIIKHYIHVVQFVWVFSLSLTLILFPLSSQAEEVPYILTAQQWNIPRTESAILTMPPLQSMMQAYQKSKPSARLLVKYPGGDEGTLWAYELRGWLISLGISSEHIELVPGSRDANQLEIYLIHDKP